MRALLAVIVVSGLAAPLAAAPRTAHLEYIGEACGQDALVARVRALAGNDPFAPDGGTHVRVEIRSAGAQLHAALHIVEGVRTLGDRELDAASCDALDDALALVITMVLARPPLEAVVVPPVIEVVHPPEAPVAAPPEERGLRFDVIGGAASTTRGQLAGVIGGRATWARLSIGFEVALLGEDSVAAAGGMVHASRVEAEVTPCRHVGRLAGCVGFAAGWVRGRGDGFVENARVRAPYAALGARIAWEQPVVGPLALRAGIEGRLPLVAQRLRVDDAIVWSSPSGELWAGLAVVARIP